VSGRIAQPGIGVDAMGGQVIDPTANVRQLVVAEAKYQDGMRAAETRRQDDLRAAETRRMNDLEAQKVRYEGKADEVLAVQVKTTSELISTQLDKVTTALGTQITSLAASFGTQISALSTSLLDRIGALEQFRWEVGGKTSVQDPALAAAMTAMAAAIASLQTSVQQGAGREVQRGETRQSVGLAMTAGMLVSAVAGAVLALLGFVALRGH
jgi:hypothetical protein